MTSPLEVLCGECVEVMRDMPDDSIDAVITDPPFFMPATHYQSRATGSWGRKWADTSILAGWWKTVADEIDRIVTPAGHALVFCNAESYPVFYPVMYERFPTVAALVWDKQRIGMGRIWRNQHELIIAARRSGAYEPQEKNRSNVLRFSPTNARDRIHPVQKPVDLLSDLVAATTPPGGVVLDPFAGSGTTLAAALSMGRRAIGIDADPEYAKRAEEFASSYPISFEGAE